MRSPAKIRSVWGLAALAVLLLGVSPAAATIKHQKVVVYGGWDTRWRVWSGARQ